MGAGKREELVLIQEEKGISRRAFITGMLALPVALATTAIVPEEADAKVRKVVIGGNRDGARVRRGLQDVTVRGDSAYMVFVAPKTKTYTFTFSRCKSKHASSCGCSKRDDVQADIAFGKRLSEFMWPYPPLSVKTEGGSVKELHLGINGANNMYGFMGAGEDYDGTIGKKKKNRIFKKRTATFKLKKGQKVYITFHDTYHYEVLENNRDRFTFRLRIA